MVTHLQIFRGDFHTQDFNAESDLYFLNPARSGIKNFSQVLLKNKPEYIIYVSCFPLSMKEDVDNLSSLYEISEAALVDQFPQTNHYEGCLLLKRKT